MRHREIEKFPRVTLLEMAELAPGATLQLSDYTGWTESVELLCEVRSQGLELKGC